MSMEKKGEDRPDRPTPVAEAAISRRSFLQGVGLAAGAAAVPITLSSARAQTSGGGIGPGRTKLSLQVNGQTRTVEVEPRVTLAETLRDHLDLTGTKVVCDRGACGGCTVMLDGKAVKSCMMWAVDARGKEILTIEGLAKPDGTLDPVQEGFIEHDAMQCAFCTPGLVMRSRAFLNENPNPTLEELKAGLAGNICRCGTYTHIFAAVMWAAKKEGQTS